MVAQLFHTVRLADGGWTRHVAVPTVGLVGVPGMVVATCGQVEPAQHPMYYVLAVTSGLFQSHADTIVFPSPGGGGESLWDVPWSTWSVPPPVGNGDPMTGTSVVLSAVGTPDGAVQYMFGRGTGESLVYITNRADGSWETWQELDLLKEGDTDQLLFGIAGTGLPNGDRQYLAIYDTNASLYHTVWSAAAAAAHSEPWQAWLPPDNGNLIGYPWMIAAAATPNGDAHFLTINNSSASDDWFLFHNIRHPDGSWQGWLPPPTTGIDGDVFGVTAAGTPNGDLQVMVATRGGKLFHTIRYAAEPHSWQEWYQVTPPDTAYPYQNTAFLSAASAPNGDVLYVSMLQVDPSQ